MSDRSIRVLAVDDHRLVRECLRAVLAGEAGIEVVGEAADGLAAIRAAESLQPDVVLMDVEMPGLNGVEAARRILAAVSPPRVIILTAQPGARLLDDILALGVAGVLTKGCSCEKVVEAVRLVARGKRVIDAVSESETRFDISTGAVTPANLSSREREVLQLISEGAVIKEIAVRLGVSPKTVETHRARIVRKLGIDRVAGLTRFALREGLTSLEYGL